MPGSDFFGTTLANAIKSGQVPEARLDDAVLRMLTPMYALGIMDRPATGDLSVDATDPARAALARDIAAAATVLLKNDKARLAKGPSVWRITSTRINVVKCITWLCITLARFSSTRTVTATGARTLRNCAKVIKDRGERRSLRVHVHEEITCA